VRITDQPAAWLKAGEPMRKHIIGEGRLILGVNKSNGFYAYDGVNMLKPWCLYLVHKILRHRNKITVFIFGKWLIWGNKIIWFIKDKKDIARHIPLSETYSRKDIVGQKGRGAGGSVEGVI